MEVEWRAFELHPEIPLEGMQPPWMDSPRFQAMEERVRQMARQAGLPLDPPQRVSNSRRALEAAEFARERGRHEAFHAAVFRAYFQEGRDIGDWAVLVEIAEEAGLDGEAMPQAVERGAYRAAVEAQIREAHQLGITGVPTFFLGDLTVVGAQSYEVFRQAMARQGLRPGREANEERSSPRTG